MEAAPASPFVVAKAEFLFEVLIVALNTPLQGTVRFSVYGAWFIDQAWALAKRSPKRMAN